MQDRSCTCMPEDELLPRRVGPVLRIHRTGPEADKEVELLPRAIGPVLEYVGPVLETSVMKPKSSGPVL